MFATPSLGRLRLYVAPKMVPELSVKGHLTVFLLGVTLD